ncbi:MAG: hypothetical protein GC191_02825 [Azospirillum sp.]|nr:hypothetical protein [Azospirillum sp.]
MPITLDDRIQAARTVMRRADVPCSRVAVRDRDAEELVMLIGLDDGRAFTRCGGGRQRLFEFAGPQTLIHVCVPEGPRRSLALGELLPAAVTPGSRVA